MRDAQHSQAGWIDAYRAAFAGPGSPRAQVSRAVYPHPDRAEAVRPVTPDVRRWQSRLSARRDVAAPLVSFVPGMPDLDEHLRLLTSTAREVVPLREGAR